MPVRACLGACPCPLLCWGWDHPMADRVCWTEDMIKVIIGRRYVHSVDANDAQDAGIYIKVYMDIELKIIEEDGR